MATQPYGYYIIIGDLILDINDLDVYMLTEEDLAKIEDLQRSYPTQDSFAEDLAYGIHSCNVNKELKRFAELSRLDNLDQE